VLGHDVVREAAAVRRLIALAGQAATVDEDLTGRENLLFLGRLSGLSRAGTGLLLAFALCLSWAWTALGLLLRTAQAVMSIGTVVLFPLTLASNVFVQPATMPGWLQAFVRINPVSHLVTAERGLLAGHPVTGQIAWVLLAAAALLAVFAPLTGYLYTRRA
jgi:ABC-type multidrug transport system permease subunit